MEFATAQEGFWAGDFGDAYIDRNSDPALLARNMALFGRVLARTEGISTMIEYGANIGLNIRACLTLLPGLKVSAVEINRKAHAALSEIPGVETWNQSILDFSPPRQWDLVLIKGVLIHTAPARLPDVYRLLHRSASRYICIVEYYNPKPVEVVYHGHSERLFKRDFAGELMDAHPDVRLVDYGFTYHRDPVFPQDDSTWFLLEKRS